MLVHVLTPCCPRLLSDRPSRGEEVIPVKEIEDVLERMNGWNGCWVTKNNIHSLHIVKTEGSLQDQGESRKWGPADNLNLSEAQLKRKREKQGCRQRSIYNQRIFWKFDVVKGRIRRQGVIKKWMAEGVLPREAGRKASRVQVFNPALRAHHFLRAWRTETEKDAVK